MNADVQGCLPISIAFWCSFSLQKPCIFHPNKVLVVQNYAFSGNVYGGEDQSIPKFLSKDISLLRKDFTLKQDMIQGGDA